MIRTLQGVIQDTTETSVIVDILGFGIAVYAPSYDIAHLHVGDTVRFYTYLALRENAVDLYGFSEEKTRAFFELLLGISGVGPRSALGITNLAPVETLIDAIRGRDISYLTRVAGVGKKMAEKIVLELKDKIPEGDTVAQGDDIEILDTLIALGYKEREAKVALQKVPNTITDKDARLKAALKS
jgi:Holliday junction DNA helicase RuvA